MTSSSPLGPFTYRGTCFNNPGDFFGTAGNNHHTIITFKGQTYIFYHAEWLNKQAYGSMLGYRTTHVDVMPVNGNTLGQAKGTLTGVKQLFNYNPYQTCFFHTMAWQGGIAVYGSGYPSVAFNRGDWIGVSNADFSSGARSVTIRGGSVNGATVRISVDSPTGTVIGYVTIPRTGDNYNHQDATGTIQNVWGVKNLFFVASGDCVLSTYKFSS